MDNITKLTDFKKEDFRTAIRSARVEVEELQVKRLELMKERRTLETAMYMLYPEEAVRDGYMSATRAIACRLSRAKERRENLEKRNDVPRSNSASSGALMAEAIVKGMKAHPKSVVKS